MALHSSTGIVSLDIVVKTVVAYIVVSEADEKLNSHITIQHFSNCVIMPVKEAIIPILYSMDHSSLTLKNMLGTSRS
jgi:hypothetical protein